MNSARKERGKRNGERRCVLGAETGDRKKVAIFRIGMQQEDEKLNSTICHLAMQELKLREIRKAKEEMSSVMNERQ